MDAGLPEISGRYNTDIGSWVRPWLTEYSGAYFSTNLLSSNAYDPVRGTQYNKYEYFNFSANKSNSIYGNSDTVTPTSTSVIYLIRY